MGSRVSPRPCEVFPCPVVCDAGLTGWASGHRVCRREPCIYCEPLTTQGQEGSGDSARFLPLGGVSRGVGGVPPTSEMESSAWRERGWGAGALQGQRPGRLAAVTVSASDRRGQRQFLPGQLSAGPRRARRLGARWTAYSRARVLLRAGRGPVKQVSVVTRPEPLLHDYLHRESHMTRLL